MAYKKGVADEVTFSLAAISTGAAITSGTVTVYITKDGGTQATTTNSATHKGNGQWHLELTATEMDADSIGLLPTHTDAPPRNLHISTETKLVSDLNDVAATDIVSNGAITTADGVAQADVRQLLGTAITETTAGNVAGTFSDYWDNDDSASTSLTPDFEYTKQGNLSTDTELAVTAVSNTDTVTFFKGGGKTITMTPALADHDFTGRTVKFHLRQVNDVAGADASDVVTGSVSNAGSASQSVTFTWATTDTSNFALSVVKGEAKALTPSYLTAYRWTATHEASGDATDVVIFGEGAVIVKDDNVA